MSATDVGLRWARELRRQYGGTAAAKRIARDFGVEVRTAAAWMQGGVPFVRHLCRAADLFGAAFVLRVLSPDSELAGCADVDQAIDVLRVLSPIRSWPDAPTLIRPSTCCGEGSTI